MNNNQQPTEQPAPQPAPQPVPQPEPQPRGNLNPNSIKFIRSILSYILITFVTTGYIFAFTFECFVNLHII